MFGAGPDRSATALAEFGFAEPVGDEEVRRLAREYGVGVEEAQGEFEIGGQAYQEGFAEDGGEDLDEARLADVAEAMEDLPEEERREMEPQISAMRAVLEVGDAGSERLSTVTFTGAEALMREERAPISGARVTTPGEMRFWLKGLLVAWPEESSRGPARGRRP